MHDPQMQWRMVKIGEGQSPRNCDCIAFVNPKVDGESKQKARNEESSKHCEGEAIFPASGIQHSNYSRIWPRSHCRGTAPDSDRAIGRLSKTLRLIATDSGAPNDLDPRTAPSSEERSPRPTIPDVRPQQLAARRLRCVDR